MMDDQLLWCAHAEVRGDNVELKRGMEAYLMAWFYNQLR